jgi:hypothetical protein
MVDRSIEGMVVPFSDVFEDCNRRLGVRVAGMWEAE